MGRFLLTGYSILLVAGFVSCALVAACRSNAEVIAVGSVYAAIAGVMTYAAYGKN